MLQNNEVVPLNNFKDIDPKLSGDIYDGIRYLCDLNSCESIKELFSVQYNAFAEKHKQDFENQNQKDLEYYKNDQDQIKLIQTRKYYPPYSWEIVQAITDTIKVAPYYGSDMYVDRSYNYSIDYKTPYFPIDVTGYSQLYQM